MVQSTSAPKGPCEGELQQAVRSSQLEGMEMGSVVLRLPNQGLGDLLTRALRELLVCEAMLPSLT